MFSAGASESVDESEVDRLNVNDKRKQKTRKERSAQRRRKRERRVDERGGGGTGETYEVVDGFVFDWERQIEKDGGLDQSEEEEKKIEGERKQERDNSPPPVAPPGAVGRSSIDTSVSSSFQIPFAWQNIQK